MNQKMVKVTDANGDFLFPIGMYDEIVSELDDLMVIVKLSGYVVDIKHSGTMLTKLIFKKENENFNICFFKNIDKTLSKIEINVGKSSKDKIMKLFSDDMDIDFRENRMEIKVYTHIKSAMVKILKKIKWL